MIVDFHTHIFPPEVIERKEEFLEKDRWFEKLYASPKARLITAEKLIAEMDRAGVDKAVTFGFAWADMGLCRMSNDYVLEAMACCPERLIGFASLNPAKGEKAIREAVRCAEMGMLGLGELMPDGQGFRLDDEKAMAPVVEVALSYGLVIQSHTSEPVGHFYPGKGETTPESVARFAQLFPEVKLVCAHWGGGLFFYELMPEMKSLLRNVYYDTAASLLLYRDKIFPLAAEIAGDKILFGTDYPLIGQRLFLRRIEKSGLSPAARSKLLGENAAWLLNMESRRTRKAWK
ncbi:MAG: amidohydrolase family protein [Anaerolineae bacterium]